MSNGCSCTRARRVPTGSSARSAPLAPARRPPSESSPTHIARARYRCWARRRAAAPRTSWPAQPACQAARCTGSCSTPSAKAACLAAASSLSTRPGWPKRACSRRCSSSSTARRGRRSSSAIPALCERLGVIELSENRRQRDLSERQALARLRAGDPEPYLAHAASRGRLQVADDATIAKQRLLEDWWQVAQHDLHGTGMLAYRRADVRDLNEAARTLLMRAGRLGPEAVELGEREFRVGDRVLCRHNDPRLGVRNGTRATVVDLDDRAVTLRTGKGATRLVPLAYAADHLEHGYATTGHAAQGATVERAFVLLHDHGALQEWGYVACSRARTETRLYLAGTEREPDAHARQPNKLDAPERTAPALARSSAEPLALAQGAAKARLLAQRQRQLERQRSRAQERLADARERLERLGWRGRRHRAELRAEITLYQTALRLADEKLNELTLQTPRTLQQAAPPRNGHELSGSDRGNRAWSGSLRVSSSKGERANALADDQRRANSPSGAISAFASFGSTPSSRDASRLVRIPTFAASFSTGSSITPR